MDHSDIEDADVIFYRIDLAVINSRSNAKISLWAPLFPPDSNGILDQILLYHTSIRSIVPLLIGWRLSCVDDRMFLAFR